MNAPLPLSVTLTPEPALLEAIKTAEGEYVVVQDYEIDCDNMADIANQKLREIKQRMKAIDEWEKKFTKPALDIVATARQFFKPAKDSLKSCEDHLKAALGSWTAKLEAQAAEARRAAAIAVEAAPSSDAAIVALASVPIEVAPPKLEGLSKRDNWKADLDIDVDEMTAKLRIVSKITGVPVEQFQRPDLISLLEIGWASAHAMAKSQKQAMNVPGLRSVNKQIMASRAA